MIKCPSCSIEVGEEKQSCPSCGTSLEDLFAPTRQLTDSQRQAAVHRSQPPPSSRRTRQASVHSSITPDYVGDARFAPGSVFAERYRIVGLLGRGGMGEVYRADDLKLSQPVALKFLPENLLDDGAALARFHREVRTARQITHRNVCRVYDIGEIEGEHFLSMEFVRGEDLASLLRRIGRLPSDKAVEIARQLCAGLAAAHDIGVLHRDLKPANIMIDAQGNVRIMDFGLAGLEEELREARAIEGTPEYMSPEQLEGKELTAQSDIYSLGLVLYEVFTGKKAFEAATLAELLRLRKKDTTPASISSLNKHIDPLVERIIERCLERDPDKRPSSAIQVAAALPGGDPLAAALAAGETPSPEMVAAAAKEGSLKPAVAVACLAFVVLGSALALWLSGQMMLHRKVPLNRSKDFLRERAGDVVKKLGYTDPPTDRAFGFYTRGDYLNYLQRTDNSPSRWDRLAQEEPAALVFWYRQSPRYLEPIIGENVRVTGGDPPTTISGMVNIDLDLQGRLVFMLAVPPQLEEASGQTVQPADWSLLFQEAGLDMASFKPTAPKWNPLITSDARAAWTGTYPGRPDTQIHVEAASFKGKPVYFTITGPWSRPGRMQAMQASASERASQIIMWVLLLSAMVGGVLLARHNLRLGRGDRRGAFRLALFVFISFMIAWLLRGSHVPTQAEVGLFLTAIQFALLITGLVWLFYISIEPFVRRNSPQRIISWSRLLAGGWRDPLVGRDVLLGALFGTAISLVAYLRLIVPKWLGMAPPQPATPTWEHLLGLRMVIGYLFYVQLNQTIFLGIGILFLLLLLTVVVRKEWIAIGLLWLLLSFALTASVGSDNFALNLLFGGLNMAIVFIALVRFGLLSCIAALFFYYLWADYLITSDFSAWYAEGTIAALVIVALLAGYGFYTSLAGQPLFRGGLLKD